MRMMAFCSETPRSQLHDTTDDGASSVLSAASQLDTQLERADKVSFRF